MRGSIKDTGKAKSHAVAKAKKKAVEEDKKLSTLQQRISKIRKAKLDKTTGPSTGSR